jgi:hypothetical protein
MSKNPLELWHGMVRNNDPSGLSALIAEDAVFYSPVVHSAQRGRNLVVMYLSAAFQVFFNPTFRYVRQIASETEAVLEFETEIDGIRVNGVDLIQWNDKGEITEFKVMVRPLKGLNVIHQRMAAMLQPPAPAR